MQREKKCRQFSKDRFRNSFEEPLLAYLSNVSRKCLRRVKMRIRGLCCEIPCEAEIQIEITFQPTSGRTAQ